MGAGEHASAPGAGSRLRPERLRRGLVVVDHPGLGHLVATEMEDVHIVLVERPALASRGLMGQDDDALVALEDLGDLDPECPTAVLEEPAELSDHVLDSLEIAGLRALPGRVPHNVAGEDRAHRVHVAARERGITAPNEVRPRAGSC